MVSFVTSWDDGHPLDLRLADLLDRRGFKGTFYIPIDNQRESQPVMQTGEIRQVDARFEVGSHTFHHVPLPLCADDDTALREIETGKRALEQAVGHEVTGFCFPMGRFGRRHVALAARAGVRHARTVVNLHALHPRHAFLVHTTLQFYPHRRAVIASNYVAKGAWAGRFALARIAWREDDLGSRLRHMLELLETTQNGVFHLWGHSWEIDQFDGWRLLDEFLRFAADRIPPEVRTTVAGMHHVAASTCTPTSPAAAASSTAIATSGHR